MFDTKNLLAFPEFQEPVNLPSDERFSFQFDTDLTRLTVSESELRMFVLNTDKRTQSEVEAFLKKTPTRTDDVRTAFLTESQFGGLLKRLCSPVEHHFLGDTGSPPDCDGLVCLAFGKGDVVNVRLASICDAFNGVKAIQDDVYKHVKSKGGALNVTPANPDVYFTSIAVLKQASAFIRSKGASKILLVCQSWHGPRCLDLCQNAGLTVTASSTVDAFAPKDLQLWVRSLLAWEIKEIGK